MSRKMKKKKINSKNLEMHKKNENGVNCKIECLKISEFFLIYEALEVLLKELRRSTTLVVPLGMDHNVLASLTYVKSGFLYTYYLFI
jgi:hypothetical protein